MSNNEQENTIAKSFSQKGVFPSKYAFTLLIPVRNIFLSPKQLIKRLQLKENMQVLELGPGPGYFSTKVAGVLSKGKLVLADVQNEMLNYAKKRITKKGLINVEYYLCDGKSFRFEENTFDRIFMVTVIGEVENKDAYMAEFYRILKKDGILSVSEQAGDPDKMSINEVKQLAGKYNFLVDTIYGEERNYTINFKK